MRDTVQQRVYETEAQAMRVFGLMRREWSELTAEERERYGMRLVALVMCDRAQGVGE